MLLRLAAALVVLVLPWSAQGNDAPARYARVSAAGARVLNLNDANAAEVHRPSKGSLLAVYRETDAWLEVEAPGGFAVWVFGRFLGETAEPDVYRVNGDGVNLRPQPSRGVTNFPLGQQLYTGDQVRVIERADPTLPLKEDWVRIWSPPGVRGWIARDAVSDLAPGEEGAALWKTALAGLPSAPARADAARLAKEAAAGAQGRDGASSTAANSPAPAPERSAETKAFDGALDAAVTRMEDERNRPEPDWSSVRALFTEAERQAPTGAERLQVRQGLQTLAALEEASALRARLEQEKVNRAEAVHRERDRVQAESREKDPLGGVFLARGGLERRIEGVGDAQSKRYFLRFGTGVGAEIVCVSGRYDLDLYVGYQIGVRGLEIAPASGESPRQIEVSRLEVTGRRP
jgi:hypothetical protein